MIALLTLTLLLFSTIRVGCLEQIEKSLGTDQRRRENSQQSWGYKRDLSNSTKGLCAGDVQRDSYNMKKSFLALLILSFAAAKVDSRGNGDNLDVCLVSN